MKNYKISDEQGSVCGNKVVDETDDLIIISNNGVIIRIRVSDVRLMGRYATGVRVMRLGENENVVAFTRTEDEEDAAVEKIEQPSEEELRAEEQEAMMEEAEEVIDDSTDNDDEDQE